MVGWSDLPADLADRARLARLAAHLPRAARVVSSDLVRATDTAAAIAGDRPRLPPEPDLREIHFGDWELQPFDQVPDQDRLRAFWDRPGEIRPPGGESWNQLRARVDAAVARLLARHPGCDIVAVAHMGPILAQVQGALGISAYQAFGHRIAPLSVTEMHHHAGGWHVATINHCP
jgi:broad specificity phosphatase PhoE